MRLVSTITVMSFVLLAATQNASASELALKPISLSGPVAFLRSLFSSGPAVPQQGRGQGQAESGSHANKGAGTAPKPGAGQLPAATPTHKKAAAGKSSPAYTGYNAKTSERLPSRSTSNTTWWQNADGSQTERLSSKTVNYKDSAGDWQPIDASLAKGADGRLHQRANGFGMSLAAGSGIGGAADSLASPGTKTHEDAAAADSSQGELVDLSLGANESAGWSLAGAADVTPTVSADGLTTTYPQILTDTTLRLTSENDGVKESFVLSSAAAPNSWTFPLSLTGVTLQHADSGAWRLVDSSGAVVAQILLPEAWDANVDPNVGLAPTTSDVTYSLATVEGVEQLTMTLNPSWLHDPARQFPVTVDPTVSVSIAGQKLSTYVDEGFPDQNYLNYSDEGQYIKLGSDNGGNFDLGYLDYPSGVVNTGYHISAASFAAFDQHAWNTSTSYDYDVDAVACTTTSMCWAPSSITWNNRPPSIQTQLGSWAGSLSSATCNGLSGRWEYTDLNASYMNNYSAKGQLFYGLELIPGSSSDANYWKIFDSSQVGSCSPYISLTYTPDAAPQIDAVSPLDGTPVNSLTPQLSVSSAHDPDAFPNASLSYYFAVYPSTGGKAIVDSGSDYLSTGSWTVPAGKLAWGKTYQWYVCAFDGFECESSAEMDTFTTTAPPPVLTGGLSQDSDGHGFNAALGDYTTSVTDASEAAVGPALSVVRDYNSLDTRTSGAFGASWSSVLDAKATEVQDANGNLTEVVVTYPDGSQVVFAANANGTFAPPAGRYATFVVQKDASHNVIGYTLSDKDGTTYTFESNPIAGSNGATTYGVTAIADKLGRKVTFAYTQESVTPIGQSATTVNVPTTMTSSASGRSLAFHWTQPSGANSLHVDTVTTDRSDPNDASTVQLWTYKYNNDQLTAVCAPSQQASSVSDTACTQYSYQSLSDYQSAVLDTDPTSYWPLSDAAGSTSAVSRAAGQAGTDVGTYSGSTIAAGDAAHLTGSTATTAKFVSASQNYVTLPSSLLSNRTYLSVAMWFKTTTAGGILFSEQNTPLASTPTHATPSLYVGTDGHLYGEWYAGQIHVAVSHHVVTDGQWHFVVLSGAGNHQTMYLDQGNDGNVTESGYAAPITNLDQTYDYVGAGYSTGGWPNSPTGGLNYFNGSISDVAFYTRGLTPTDVDGLVGVAGHAGSFLHQITRPSGKISTTVSYDSVTGRVNELTDSNGATWSLGAPQSAGSSAVYKGAVLAQAPEAYWRLGDAAGATNPYDEINPDGWAGTPGLATYTNASLGASGPFTDGSTAATFNGTSSNVKLPSGVLDNHVNVSVSMWFKTATSGFTNGVLFSHSATGISAGSAPSNFQPWLYVGADGHLVASVGPGDPVASPSRVNDAKWHQLVFSISGSVQSLYVDGALAGSGTPHNDVADEDNIYVGTGYIGGGWPDEGHDGALPALPEYFNGSISDVAVFDSTLDGAQASELWQGYKSSLVSTVPVTKVSITDPPNSFDGTRHTESYAYDPLHSNRLVSYVDASGGTTTYGYDTSGYVNTVTDPNGDQTITGHDVRGNVVSNTTCQYEAQNKCQTSYMTYFPDDTTAQLPYPLDPRDDMEVTSSDARSSSKTDTTYQTKYNLQGGTGLELSETTPPVPGFSAGRTSTATYTDSSSTSCGANPSTPPPAGLVHTSTTPAGAVTTRSYYANGDVCSVTDPNGEVTSYTYDGLGRTLTKTVTSDTYPNGLVTSYSYDGAGHVINTVAPTTTDYAVTANHDHTAVTTATYDVDGDMLTQSVADQTGGDAPRTIYYSYNSHDQKATSSDARSSSATDTTYQTTYTYDPFGNIETSTDPLGRTTKHLYDATNRLRTTEQLNTAADTTQAPGSTLVVEQRAYDAGGRLKSVTDGQGNVTNYLYYDDNELYQVSTTDGSHTFITERDTYDAAGNLTKKLTNNLVTETDYSVDADGRTGSTVVDPSGVDRTATVSFSADDQILSTTSTGATGSSTTDYSYDMTGNVLSKSVEGLSANSPALWWRLNQQKGTSIADASGHGISGIGTNVTMNGDSASFAGVAGQQIVGSAVVLDTTQSYSMSAWVNLTSLSNVTFVSQHGDTTAGFLLQADAGTKAWRFALANADTNTTTHVGIESAPNSLATGTWTLLTATVDASAETMKLYVNGAQVASAATPTLWNAHGAFTVGAAEIAGTMQQFVNGKVSNLQVYKRVLSSTDVSTLYDGGAGRTGGALGTTSSTTTTTRDERGLPTSTTDPDGNTTHYVYDEAGRLAQTTSPTVPITSIDPQTGAVTTGNQAAITSTGYDTFGEVRESVDALGNETVNYYDAAGNLTKKDAPAYTAPGSSTEIDAETRYSYDADNEQTAVYDPIAVQAGATSPTVQYTYTSLGLKHSETDAINDVSTYGYDSNGELDQTTVTSPSDSTGVKTSTVHDYLGRQYTSTQVERYPTPTADTTTYNYDDQRGGWLSSVTSPSGKTPETYSYDAIGEKTKTTDAANDATAYTYDYAGRVIKTTLPDNTSSTSTYDALGDVIGTADYDHTGAQLTSTSALYDAAGRMTKSVDAMGNATKYFYDATGLLTSEVQDSCVVSSTCDYETITVGYGYDLDGHQTAYADGDELHGDVTDTSHTTYTAYNSWGLPEQTIEPPANATTYTALSDRTTTSVYDPDGRLTSQTGPGGVTTQFQYNPTGTLSQESGSGAQAATATRSFSYNAFGDVLSAQTSGVTNTTNETFSYDDRGNVLSTGGSAGTSSFTYDADGLMTSRQDASGTISYAYDNQDRLQNVTDPLTSTASTYTYTPDSQVNTITYGTGNDVRSFSYDDLHRVTADVLKSGSTNTGSITYGYDDNGNLTSKTQNLGGTTSNTYTYDRANRLTSWTTNGTTTEYAYDRNSNRTKVGANVYSYDWRDELTSDGTDTYSYTAAGMMTAKTLTSSGVVQEAYTSDAYGQQVGAGSGTYTYDASGRMVGMTAGTNTTTLQYSGTGNEVASDGSDLYARGPSGALYSTSILGGAGRLLWTDLHTDVVGDFAPNAAGSVQGSVVYDPLGKVLTTGGNASALSVGYQSEWTDTSTGEVNMDARWYNPATGQFTSKDSVSNSAVPNTANANPFGYANANPLINTDPTGHRVAADPTDCPSGTSFNEATSTCAKPRSTSLPTTGNSNSGSGGSSSDGTQGGSNATDIVTYQDPEVCATLLCYQQVSQQVSELEQKQSTIIDDAMASCATKDCFAGNTSVANMLVEDGGQYTDGRGIYTDAVAAEISSEDNAALKAAQAAEKAQEKASATQKCGWTHIGGCLHNASVWVNKHPLVKSIVVGAVGVGTFLGCMAATTPLNAVGCGAVSGMVSNSLNYAIGAEATGKGSIGGLLETAGIGAVTGAATAGIGGGAGSVADDLISNTSITGLGANVLKGAFTGAAMGGVSSAGAYVSGCATGGDCSLGGLGKAVLGGTLGGAVLGAASGAAAGSADDVEPTSCAVPHSFVGDTKVLMAGGGTKPIDQIKVGDKISDAIPGMATTDTNTVTAVITTYTDHDFVDVGIAPLGATAPVKTASASSTATTSQTGVIAGSAAAAPKQSSSTSRLVKSAVGVAAALSATTGIAASTSAPTAQHYAANAAATTATTVQAAGGVLTTTFHHPFYDLTQTAFVDAQNLQPGDELQTPTGRAQVTSVRVYHANTTTYDLTIGALHTYYVVAGGVPILVHNTSCPRVFAVDSSGVATALPVHEIDSSLYPGVAANFDKAIASGASPILTRMTGRANIRANRNAAQAGLPRPGTIAPGMSWEEFPFASTYEGGSGATTSLIPQTENVNHGRDSLWRGFLDPLGLQDGDQYYVRRK